MAEQSKKTRSELKSLFVPNAIPTADDFARFIDSGVNQVDDGVRVDAGNVTVSGAVEARNGLTVTGAAVTIGATNAKQPLNVNGTITATDTLTAQNGFTVSTGTVFLNTSATIAGQLAVSGQVIAHADLALTGTLTAAGGPVTIGDSATNLAMTVHHTLTVNRETVLNKGLTVKSAGVTIGDSDSPQSLTVNGSSSITGGAVIQNGLTVSSGALNAAGSVVANAGLIVKGAQVSIGEPAAKQNVVVEGAVTATEVVNANKGLNVNGAVLNANAGLNVAGSALTVGTTIANQNLVVNGVAQAKTFMLAAPPNDPAPIMTARTIPAGQGAANESTEFILFHGDDYSGSGFGPDYITLRAPAIRLQTYANVGSPTIDNNATSNTRFHIDSYGYMSAYGTLVVNGPTTSTALLTASSGLNVTGATALNGSLSIAQVPRSGNHVASVLGAYITGDFTDTLGVEIRHSNGSQGIGFGFNTIYATGSNTDQNLRLKSRGAGCVEVASNLNVTGIMTGPPNDYTKVQFTMNGGGTITWANNRLKWSGRMIAISAGNNATTMPIGYVNIGMPGQDLPASSVYDGAPRSVTSAGLLLTAWEALYAEHTMGGNPDAVTYHIVRYDRNHWIPSNWIFVAVVNGDDGSVKLGTGQTIGAANQMVTPGAVTVTGPLTANVGATITGVAAVNGALSVAQVPRSGNHPTTILGSYVTGQFADSLGAEFRHSNGTQGIGIGLNTIYAAGTDPDQPLRLKARGNSSVEVLGNLNISGNLSGAPNDYFRAQFSLSGGGAVTWTGGRLKWTSRFLAISVGVSAATLAAGHITINMPTVDIPAANVYDGVARSVTSAGVLLKPYEALYAVHTMGQNQTAVDFRIVIYNVTHIIPANWLLVAVMNNDDGSSIKLGTGQTILNNNADIAIGPSTAQSGLTVTNGGLTVVGQTNLTTGLTVNGPLLWSISPVTADSGLTVNNAPLYANSVITANAGITVNNAPLYTNSILTVNAGLTVNSGPLWSNSLVTANAGLTVNNGPLWSNSLVTANSGLTVNGSALWSNSLVTANAGLNVNNGPLNIGFSSALYQLTVNGTAIVNSLLLVGPPGDPSPSISTRTIPAGQGNANESTEFILFHGNDGLNGTGPDYITLRSPALRFQTYNDTGVMDINNVNGSQTRMSIDPNGSISIFGAITSTYPVTAPTFILTAPPGDPSPVITARTVPVNQGNANESTELILFHSNDGLNGAGPDYITLRAPGLRFQTYNDATVSDINNPNGSQTRMYIDPLGAVNIYPGILRLGPNGNVGNGLVTSVLACMAYGVSHGQLAYRGGSGFELVDISAGGPNLNYARDSLPYTDLRLRQLQYQTQSQFSSRTLKEDIRELSADEAMVAFDKLQPVTYRFKDDSTKRAHAGFIAEDVPDLVSMDDHKAISPPDILAVLTRVVHLQQEAIRRLEAQIAALVPA